MKKLILISAFLCSFQHIYAIDDKLTHTAVSFMATVTTKELLRYAGMNKTAAAITSFSLVNTVGVVKEMTDSTGFDKGDIGANLLGSGLGLTIILTFD